MGELDVAAAAQVGGRRFDAAAIEDRAVAARAALPVSWGGDGGGRLAGQQVTSVDVIIPAFNEVGRLLDTLVQTVAFLQRQPWRARVIVVDNGSVDNTGAVGAMVRPGGVRLDVVGCSRAGKGAAVRRGLAETTARFVGFFDADLATPIPTLGPVIELLQAGAGAVIASRHIPGARFVRKQSLRRRMGGAAFRLLARPLVAGVADTQCGFKFFDRAVVQEALAQCRVSNFAFDVELLHHIQRAGASVVEVPVAWTDGVRSTFHPIRDGIPAFAALLQLQRSVLR